MVFRKHTSIKCLPSTSHTACFAAGRQNLCLILEGEMLCAGAVALTSGHITKCIEQKRDFPVPNPPSDHGTSLSGHRVKKAGGTNSYFLLIWLNTCRELRNKDRRELE